MSGRQANTIYRQNALRIVTTDEDTHIDTNDDQVHVVGTDDDVTVVTLTLPCNPKVGEQHLLVATSAPITVDGNGADVTAGYESIPVGYSMLYTFSQDQCSEDDDDAGIWIPLALPAVEVA